MTPCDPKTETCYRKRPMAVRAFQMTEAAMNREVPWPDHLESALRLPAGEVGSLSPGEEVQGSFVTYEIATLEGPHIVNTDAWIVQGPEGEIWAVKDSIFRKTYEKICA